MDLFRSIADDGLPRVLSQMKQDLPGSQQRIVDYCKTLVANIPLILGLSGTGKTYMIIRIDSSLPSAPAQAPDVSRLHSHPQIHEPDGGRPHRQDH